MSSHLPFALLNKVQQAKMRWHHRLNHIKIDQLTAWMHSSMIKAPSEVNNVSIQKGKETPSYNKYGHR
jgi:hypothetical protein